MGMIGGFKRITATELDALLADPDQVADIVFPEDGEGEGIDIDKAWHGLHFLLTGESYGGTGPLAQAVLGGTEIGEDMGYGPGRYLTVEAVAEVSAALSHLSPDALAERFDAEAFTSNDIYPLIWDEGDPAVEYLLDGFRAVSQYYAAAAADGDAMLMYIA